MTQKTVLLGVTGCIAAYKACEVVRGLQKAGVRVRVVMTKHAAEFVAPLTFEALTHDTVSIDMFGNPADPIPHIRLAEEADLFLIAPCTANVVAKVAHGIADDLLTSTALAATCPLMIAPAMNVHMYENSATMSNLGKLEQRGVQLIEADSGYLACGYEGKGRLADPEAIVAAVLERLGVHRDLEGRRVMITAGPTVEPIDPVRFISNHSSGKMGYALARAAARRGAQVVLISGPVALSAPEGVHVMHVQTACQMMEAAREAFQTCDMGIFSAAVADVRPASVADCKLKKGVADAELRAIQLIENPDILATLAAEKAHRVVVGFAAETNDVIEYAQRKLAKKGADFMVANQVGAGKVFGSDSNQAYFVDSSSVEDLPLMSKDRLADAILDKALGYLR